MPKLSAYVHQQAGQLPAAPLQAAGAVPPPSGAGTGQSQGQLAQPRSQQLQAVQQQRAVAAEQQGLEQLQNAAAAKLQADYAKRLREHGPRTFRWPDGSLRPERPPPNPHAVVSLTLFPSFSTVNAQHLPISIRPAFCWASRLLPAARCPPCPNPRSAPSHTWTALQANRRDWAPLVQHCRTHGGDQTYERTGASLRYGLGVAHERHAAHLATVGLQPEADAQG